MFFTVGRARSATLSVFVLMFSFLILSSCPKSLLASDQVTTNQFSPNVNTSVGPDLFTGGLTSAIPIAVPPGRDGMAPMLNLVYNGRGENGWLGVGWQLEVGSIERNTRNGVSYHVSSDDFVLKLNGVAGELVKIASGEYRLKIESSFLRVRKLEDEYGRIYWEVTDKIGTRYYFGRARQSRQDNHANIDQIFRWCLDWVEDVHGNYMSIGYVKDQDQIYLSQIDYTGHRDQSGQITMPPAHRVRFFLEDRADPWTSFDPRWATYTWSPPLGVRTAKQLKSIAAYANNHVHAAYSFSYSQSPSTERSLLRSVRRYGSNAVIDPASGVITSGTVLPAQYFTYSLDEHKFAGQSNGPNLKVASDPAWAAVDLTRVRYGDFNGDGRTDVLYIPDEGSSHPMQINGAQIGPAHFVSNVIQEAKVDLARVKLGDFNGDGRTDLAIVQGFGSSARMKIYYSKAAGSGFDPAVDGPSIWLGDTPDGRLIDLDRIKLGDFNGDGKTDLLIVYGWASTAAVSIHYAAASGSGFAPPVSGPSFSVAGSINGAQADMARFQVADFNGNGRSDLLYVNSAGQVKVYYSYPGPGGVGGGMVKTSVNGPQLSIRTDPALALVDLGRLLIGDFNGDGLADLGYIDGLDAWKPIKIYLSTGTNFIEGPPGPDAYVAATVQGGQIDVARVGVGDFNGDGKTDIYRVDAAGSTSPYFFLSTGDGFFVGVHYGPYFYVDPYPAKTLNDLERIRVGDFNGDGKIDLSRIEGSSGTPTPLRIHLADGPFADLLTAMTNGIGGAQIIAYQPSSVYQNARLPRPLQVVSSVTSCDNYGLDYNGVGQCYGQSFFTSYAYSGGYYHIGERDFRGFNYAKVTGPAGLNGKRNITETWFHQGNDTANGYMKGKPYRQRVTDGQGNVFSEITTTYKADGTAPHFNPPQQVDTSVCDGNACGMQTRAVYTYDAYGNITREYQYGDLNDPADDRTVTRTFYPNTDAWIVGLPAVEKVFEGIGTAVENQKDRTTYYYDGGGDCTTSSTNQTPTVGNLTRVVRWLINPDGTDPADPTTKFGYDAYGNRVCTKDARGFVTSVTYDSSFTFPMTQTNALGHTMATQYYGVDGVPVDLGRYGQIKGVIDPNGAGVTTEFDPFGRKTKETLSDGSWTSWAYNSFGTVGSQHVRTANSLGLWVEEYFDGLGRPTKQRRRGPDSKVIVIMTTYDARGAVSQSSLPYFSSETPRWMTFTYDPVGRTTRVDYPDGSAELACYDDAVSVRIDANGHRKRETRDAWGRLVKVEEYTGTYTTCGTGVGTPYATTAYQYDVLGNLRFVTDALANQTEMRYDSLSRKTFMHDPDMGDWAYTYDANGNLKTQADAKAKTITFLYDALNRPTKKDYPTGTDVVFTYDEAANGYAKGRLTTMTDASGTTKNYYDDPLARTTRSVKTVDGINYTIKTVVDALGRTKSITYPDNVTVSYTYDTGGNLKTAGIYATFTGYNALGQPGTVTYGNGVVTTNQYEPGNNRLWTIKTATAAQTLLNLDYGYDKKGNVKDIFNYLDAAKSQTFGYDGLDRLTSAQSTAYGALTYTYNKIGNFSKKEGVTYTADATRPHAVGTTSNGRSYSYDGNGNMTADGQRTFAWNYDNRPTSITYGGATTTFVYDGAGSRVKKVGPAGTIVYIDKLYELSGGVPAKFIFANGQRIALKSATETLYYHQDHLGSTGVVTDQSGAKVETIFYKPFGDSFSDTGSISLNHKYTGQEFDAETGLYFYNARYYNPSLGRFISADTIVSDPANPQSLNRYSYVINNPLIYTDPTGHSWLSAAWEDSEDWLNDTEDKLDRWFEKNNISGGGGVGFSSTPGGGGSVGGFNPETGEIIGTPGNPAPGPNPNTSPGLGSFNGPTGSYDLGFVIQAVYPESFSGNSGFSAGGPPSGYGGKPSLGPPVAGGGNTPQLTPTPIPWWFSPSLNTGSAIASYVSLFPATKTVGTMVGVGFTGGSVAVSYFNWRNGYSSDERFALEVGLAVTPMIGAKFGGPITEALINIAEHQKSVIDAVIGFSLGPNKGN